MGQLADGVPGLLAELPTAGASLPGGLADRVVRGVSDLLAASPTADAAPDASSGVHE